MYRLNIDGCTTQSSDLFSYEMEALHIEIVLIYCENSGNIHRSHIMIY